MAEKSYKCALHIEPKNSNTLNNLATLEHARGNKEKAEEYFKQITNLDPSNMEAHVNNGRRYLSLHKYS